MTALYSVNLRVMGFGTGAGKANLPVSVDKYDLLVSARYVREAGLSNPIFVLALAVAIVIGLMYWYFGTESGCSLRATGANEAMARAQGINTSFAKVLGRCLRSTRAFPTSTWAVAPSSLALRPLSSAR